MLKMFIIGMFSIEHWTEVEFSKVAKKIVDKVYIVNEGAIFYEGDPILAAEDEKIRKFYLGSNFQL